MTKRSKLLTEEQERELLERARKAAEEHARKLEADAAVVREALNRALRRWRAEGKTDEP